MKSSVMAATGVILAVGAVVAGVLVRDRVDLGLKRAGNLGTVTSGGYLASKGAEVPEGDYFYELSKLVKRRYVEPIKDDQKLASGAVRGMIASLGDPKSLYMDRVEFQAYKNALKGEYQGIGAEMVLEVAGSDAKALIGRSGADDEEQPDPVADTSSKIPKLVVAAVVPGGPADKAGVRPGDWVHTVNGRWVIDPDTANAFRRLQKLVGDPAKPNPKYEQQLRSLRNELRPRLEHSLMPAKARDMLMIGTSGTVQVVWHRGADLRATNIDRAKSALPDFSANGRIVLPFEAGSADALKKAIAGAPAVTIDLRNNVLGDFDEMRACLAVLAPSGEYGTLVGAKPDRTRPFVVENGNPDPPKITLLVDGTTRGPAKIFALALAGKGIAKLVGEGMDRRAYVVENGSLPDGTGFTLATAEFRPVGSKEAAK